MAQSTTNLGKIHVFPSETLYNQFKDIIADNDLALLKDDGAYIVAALLEQNGYVKFSNGLILQWGVVPADNGVVTWIYPIKFASVYSLVTTRYAAYFDSSAQYSDKEMALSYIDAEKCRINRGNNITERIYVIAVGQA